MGIYLKIGEQSNLQHVKDASYALFLRDKILEVLEYGIKRGVSNQSFLQYHDFLSNIEKNYASYKILSKNKWEWWAWCGFFMELQKKKWLGDGEWDYVSNPQGGFMGFWWHWKTWTDCKVYLQLQEEYLCFKIEVWDKGDKAGSRRDTWHKHILKCWDGKLLKPGRLGHGTWMTVAIYKEDYRKTSANGTIDIDETVKLLHEAEQILDKAVGDWKVANPEEVNA